MTISAPLSRRASHTPAEIASLQKLRERLSGEVITADSILFDEARQVQDFTINARPPRHREGSFGTGCC